MESHHEKLACDMKVAHVSEARISHCSTKSANSEDSGIYKETVSPSLEKKDEALDLLALKDTNLTYVSEQVNKRILRKIDRNIIPIMYAIYVLQMIDKQIVALSSVFGLARETGLVGDEYSLLGSVLYIAQLIFQPISAYLLVKCRLSIYIPTIVTCWGITLACMSAARNFPGLVTSRFLLGGLEASIQGAFILTAQTWYRRREQGLRLAIWYSNTGFVNIFGTLIMFGIGHLHSTKLYTYQVACIFLGPITIVTGLLAFIFFPDNPVRCKFLDKGEKILAVERIRANQQGLAVKTFKIRQVWEMLSDLKSWCWMGLALLAGIPSGGIGTFGPLVIKGFGFNADIVMLLLIPYGFLQICSLALSFWINHKYNAKWPSLVLCTTFSLAAAVILLCTGRSKEDQLRLICAYYMLSTFNVAAPTIVNWQSSNVAGHTKKTTTTAFMMMGIISGGIIGPLMFNSHDKPYYHRGLVAMIACFSTVLVLTACTVFYLRYLNRWNKKRRVARGKCTEVVDYSMMDAAAVETEHMKNNDNDMGRHAFDDLTDLQNDEFIYVY